MGYGTNGLSFRTLSEANAQRLPLFKNALGEQAHSEPDGSDWKLTAWVNATAGELGELSEVVLLAAMAKALGSVGNMAKKVERGDAPAEQYQAQAAKEMADVVTYLDILAQRLGIDLGSAVIAKFNEISRRIGVPVFLAADDWHKFDPDGGVPAHILNPTADQRVRLPFQGDQE